MQRTARRTQPERAISASRVLTPLLAVALSVLPGLASAQSFRVAPTFATGLSPQSVAVGDFNGDSRLDLAVANNGSNTVSILLGNGSGGFLASSQLPVGSFPRAVAVADLNGDTFLDLAVVNNGANNVSILLGNGSGGFSVPVNLAVGTGPTALVVVNLDGDADLDLVVANNGSNDVSLLLGDGTGAFASGATLAAGTAPRGLATGQFNGDSFPDLAVANFSSDTVSIFLNNGAGGFGAPASVATDVQPFAIAVDDFNGDAKLDLVVTNNGADTVWVRLGNGNGSFGAQSILMAGDNPRGVISGDFNGDAKRDLAVANFSSNNVTVRLGDGSGGFGPRAQYGAGSGPVALVAAAFDGDPALDLVTANSGSNDTAFLKGDGTGGFVAAVAYAVDRDPRFAAVGDFNGDNKPDLAVTNNTRANVSILLGSGSGGFAAAVNYPAGSGPFAVAVGRFNSDAHQDLVVVNQSAALVSILLGDGSGGFGAPTQFAVGLTPFAVAVGDLNLDGRDDVVVANFDSHDISVLLGDGAGGFSSLVNYAVGVNPAEVAVGAFNADGNPDVAVANLGSNNVSVLLGDGTGAFSGGTTKTVGSQPRALVVGDFNEDARSDLAVANLAANTVSVLLGDGAGDFAAPLNFSAGSTPRGIASADFNGDSHADIVVSNRDSDTISIMIGDGEGIFASAVRFGTGDSPQGLAVADFNADAKPDVSVVNTQNRNVWQLLNTTIFLRADLSITKDDGQAATLPGAPISYTISVTNNGPSSVSSVRLVDALPSTIVSPVFTPAVGAYDSVTGQWTGLSLATGQSASLTLDGTIDLAATGSVVNTASVFPPVGVGDPVSANNSDTDMTILHTLTISDQIVTEGAGSAVFTVSLSATSTQIVTVSYATANGTAAAGSDYTATSGTLTFPPGTVARPISVTTLGDTLSEANETFSVWLTGATAAFVTDSEGVGTILDDDPPPTMSIGDASIAEGNSGTKNLVFTVSLSAVSGQTVTVDYAPAGGTATAGGDYAANAGTLSIPTGTPTGSISVTLLSDTLNEPNETFFLNLSNATGAALIDSQALGTIIDDDGPPQVSVDDVQVVELGPGTNAAFTVSLSNPSGQVVTVAYATAPGSATAGADYSTSSGTLTFSPGTTAQVAAVPVLADGTLENTESFFVNLSAPTNSTLGKARGQGWILDQSPGQRLQFSAASYTATEASGRATILVRRMGGPTGTVTVEYEASDGTATAGQDYTAAAGTLTFGPGVVSRSITLTLANDTIVDGGPETVMLRLGNAGGGAVLGSPSAAQLRITDNDVGGSLAFSAAAYSVGEAGPQVTLTVKRTKGGASGVTVEYATSNGTATAGQDYQVASGVLSFGANLLTQTITIPIVEDAAAEGDEAFSVSLANPGGGATLGTLSTATVKILENEATLQFSAPSLTVNEAGRIATLTVKRSGPTLDTVSVAYATADGSAVAGTDYTAASGVLTFGPTVTTRTFTVPITNDTIQDAAEAFQVNLSSLTGGAQLGQPSAATLTIADNDVAGILKFSVASYSVSETSALAAITVKRSGGLASGVTVDYATSDGTAVAGIDYTASSGTLSFGAGVTTRTFTILILNDGVPGGDETVNLTLSSPTGGSVLGTPAQALLTIRSDDPVLQFSVAAFSVSEKGPVATITVQRTGPTTSAVSVQYATSDGTALAGADYTATAGTLSLGPAVVKKTFTVPITDDPLIEGDETVTLTLSNPAGGAVLGARSTALLTIRTDNSVLQLSAVSYSVSEAAKSVAITVTRSGSTAGTATVAYATSNGTALAGLDYGVAAGTLTFTPGVAKKSFSIPILGDTLFEASETFNLSLSGPAGEALLGAKTAALVTIGDNDVAGKLALGAVSYSASELGPIATISVKRSGGVASGVSVDYSATPGTAVDGANFVASSGTLVFGTGETSKTFSVLILDDQAAAGNKTVNLSLGNPGGGGTLGAPATAVLWIVDSQ